MAAESASADHQRVGACGIEHCAGTLGIDDVAVGDHRDACGGFHFGDRRVLGLALECIGASAPVHRQRLDTALLGDAGDLHGIA